jgi:glutaconate CoA-transferase, subunit A
MVPMRTHPFASLADAAPELIHDGETVALEGFTHLIPVAAGRELIRGGASSCSCV